MVGGASFEVTVFSLTVITEECRFKVLPSLGTSGAPKKIDWFAVISKVRVWSKWRGLAYHRGPVPRETQ